MTTVTFEPMIASMILYLQPALTIVWASFLLGEVITTGFVIGAVLALIGVALVTRAIPKTPQGL